MNLYDHISKNITGRIALISRLEAKVLERYTAREGDHVEIGCLWGATAILAALAKKEAKVEGHVYTIDKMSGGYWQTGDKGYYNRVPTKKTVMQNFERTGTLHDITVRGVHSIADTCVSTNVNIDNLLLSDLHQYGVGCRFLGSFPYLPISRTL